MLVVQTWATCSGVKISHTATALVSLNIKQCTAAWKCWSNPILIYLNDKCWRNLTLIRNQRAEFSAAGISVLLISQKIRKKSLMLQRARFTTVNGTATRILWLQTYSRAAGRSSPCRLDWIGISRQCDFCSIPFFQFCWKTILVRKVELRVFRILSPRSIKRCRVATVCCASGHRLFRGFCSPPPSWINVD